MSKSLFKKRKVHEENRQFSERWTIDYFFTYVKDNAYCLICDERVSVFKEYNIKRHYEAKHSSKFCNLQGDFRKDKVNKLFKNFQQQKNIFKNVSLSADSAVRSSYIVSHILAKKMKPFSDGDIVKECLLAVADVYFPDKKEIISKISLSRFTIARRINDISRNMEDTLKENISKLEWISLALDDSCDINDTAQLAVFLRGTDSRFNITEELATIVPMKGTTTGEDIYRELKNVLNQFNIPLQKIVGITTDGARAMSGINVGLWGLISKDIKELTGRDVIFSHCILHQEHLCGKVLKMSNVIPVIIKIVNFIRCRGLNHREFKEFLKDMQSEYMDVLYNTEVRWLSRGKMLKRVYDLRYEINLFLEMKSKTFQEFNDKSWMCDLAFCVDITQHLNELNTNLQGPTKLINEMFDKIKAFEMKLKLWNSQLESKNMAHFPTLRNEKPSETKIYANEIRNLQEEFSLRFKILRENEINFNIFSSPFNIVIEKVPEKFQMEIIDLQSNTEISNKFKNITLMEFYKSYFPDDKFPLLATHAMQMMSLFGSTYLCEQLFSKMKIIKNDHRNRLDDDNLKDCIRIAVSNIPANIQKLVDEKQSQISH